VKRWLVLLLVILAVVLLLSPGIIGRLAEKNIDESLSRVDLDNESISIEAESFRRGWFTSAGRHRVLLQRGIVADLVNRHAGAVDGTPALVIDTRVDHGLVPVSSMQREQGSLSPALANAVSTLKLDRGDGELVGLPGRVYGFLGLGGSASFRLLMDAGRDVSGNTTTVWQGADLTFSTSADNLERSLEGTVAPATIETFGVLTELGELSVTASRDRREHVLGEGSVNLELASLVVSSPGDPAVTIGPVLLQADNRIDDGRSSGSVNLRASMEGIPRYGSVELVVDMDVARLDADALAVILGAWATLYGVGDHRFDLCKIGNVGAVGDRIAAFAAD